MQLAIYCTVSFASVMVAELFELKAIAIIKSMHSSFHLNHALSFQKLMSLNTYVMLPNSWQFCDSSTPEADSHIQGSPRETLPSPSVSGTKLSIVILLILESLWFILILLASILSYSILFFFSFFFGHPITCVLTAQYISLVFWALTKQEEFTRIFCSCLSIGEIIKQFKII